MDKWKQQFEEVYRRAVTAYDAGRTSAETMFDEADRTFLKSIGANGQEIFDYVEDASYDGDPSYEDVLEVTAIRRDFFESEMHGKFPERLVRESELPRKTDSVAGISWLPRIIAKARAKLRGALPAELMYGCGGDRPFLRRAGVRLPEFLAVVRDAGTDDDAIVAYYQDRLGS